MQQQKIHVKLQHNNEFRRFIIEPQINFNDLKQKISDLLKITTPISIRYLDEESEWITIDSDTELLTGMELSPTLLRLQIVASIPLTIPSELPNPVVEEKRRRCRKNDDTVSEEKSCKKWKKHCKRFRDEKECDGDTETGEKKCRGKWRKFREENCVNDTESDGERKCRKGRKWREENCVNDTESAGEKKCRGKWRKWRQENEEGSDDKKEFKRGPHGPRGRRAWKNFDDSDSLEETRPNEEIKKEINSLKEEIGVLVTKKKGLWEELVLLKTQIKTLRQNEGARDEIMKIREQIVEKKRAARVYHGQIANSKNRIWKLKSVLVMRAD